MKQHATKKPNGVAALVAGVHLLLAANESLAHFPTTNPDLLVFHSVSESGSHFFSAPFKEGSEDELKWLIASWPSIFGHFHGNIIAYKDPSLAYNVVLTNTLSEPQPFAFFVDFPIRPLGTNTTWAELNVELIDANEDGLASLSGNYDASGAIQGVRVSNSTTFVGEDIGPPIGSNLTAPGLQTFTLNPFAGPMPAGGDKFSLATRFILSPGDTAHLTSRFIIDEGTGIPFAAIPALPNPAGGPFFTVINVDSPDTSFGDDIFIGSQTQLNLYDGGSIGQRFQAGHQNGNNFDVEVNITGGTVGNQFTANSGSTVNISGGTVATFLAGNPNLSSTNVEVNITGGVVGGTNRLQANTGSVVNISGGTIVNLGIWGAVVNVSGGLIGQNFGTDTIQASNGAVLNLSGGSYTGPNNKRLSVFSNSVVNVSGGLFTTANHIVHAFEDSEFNFVGTEFLLDGVDIEGLVRGKPFEITQRNVTLSGLLADGSPLAIDLNPASPFPAQGDGIHAGATLTVTLILPGDYNDDGRVDAADYVVWRKNFDTNAPLSNDASPGSVTRQDYEVWAANFGKTWNGGLASDAGVPEPAALLLSLAGATGGLIARGRTRTFSRNRAT